MASQSIFLPYQQKIASAIDDKSLILLVKSRRIGGSYAVAGAIVAHAMGLAPRMAQNVYYMGFEKEMTAQFIKDCQIFLKILFKIDAKINETEYQESKSDRLVKTFSIDLPNGKEIVGLPSVAERLRSKGGIVVIDEAAFVDDLPAILKAATALTMWGGKVILISTQNGITNPFNVLLQQAKAGLNKYHVITIPFMDAIKDGFYRGVCKKMGKTWTQDGEDEYVAGVYADYGDNSDEELDCQPKASGGSLINYAQLERASVGDPAMIIRENGEQLDGAGLEVRKFKTNEITDKVKSLNITEERLTIGIDIGRTSDLTSIVILAEKSNMAKHVVGVIELFKMPFKIQEWLMIDIILMLKPRHTAIDARGIGMPLAEAIKYKFGSPISSVMLSEKWYDENMPPLKPLFQENLVILPADADIRDDFRALKENDRGVIKVSTKTGANKKRHGDTALAFALAVFASKQTIYSYDGVLTTRDLNDGGFEYEQETYFG